jgi:hypothetical protein
MLLLVSINVYQTCPIIIYSITALTDEHEQLQNFVIKDEIYLIETWMFNIISDHLRENYKMYSIEIFW